MMLYLGKIITAIAIFSIIFSAIGVASNIISIIICSQKELRKVPTFIFKIFVNVMNLIPLITIVLCPFITYYFEFELNKLYFEIGKIVIFLALWSTHSSAYLQVFLYLIFILICLNMNYIHS